VIDLLDQPFVGRLGWTLIHFLWQGSAIALLLALTRVAFKRHSAQVRYGAACLALAAMAMSPILTLASLTGDGALGRVSSVSSSALQTNAVQTASTVLTPNSASFSLTAWAHQLNAIVPWVVATWFVGVCALAMRLCGGWMQVQRLRKRATERLGEPWLSKLEELQVRLEISRSVELLKSALVEVPTVIGWLRPVILVPASALTGLTPQQLDSILAHELAHIRRNDYLVNLLQRVVETLLFYHPAVWWVSKCIRIEREHSCDDLVLQVCGDRQEYARALVSLEELRIRGSMPFVIAATDGSLKGRIRRLFGKSSDEHRFNWLRIALFVLAGSAVCILAVAAIRPRLPFYESTVRFQVDDDADRLFDDLNRLDSGWFHTQHEIILSRPVLNAVVDNLKLVQKFANRQKTEPSFSKSGVVKLLIQRMSIRHLTNTRLIDVRVRDEDPRLAAEIANEIANAYLRTRNEASNQAIRTLGQQISEAEQEMEAAKKKADQLRIELGIENPNQSENHESVATDAGEIYALYAREHATLELKLENYSTLLEALKRMPKDRIADAIPNTSYPDPTLSQLLNDLNAAERDLVSVSEEFGTEHSKALVGRKLIAKLREQIERRVEGILEALQGEVNRHRAQLEFVAKKLEGLRMKTGDSARYGPYHVAQQEFDRKRRMYETLALRLQQERADSRAAPSTVRVVDPAEPALRPIRRWFWNAW